MSANTTIPPHASLTSSIFASSSPVTQPTTNTAQPATHISANEAETIVTPATVSNVMSSVTHPQPPNVIPVPPQSNQQQPTTAVPIPDRASEELTNVREETGDSDGVDDEHDTSDSEEDPAAREHAPYPWLPIREDTSTPCSDELQFIESRVEHSAVDHSYWEQKTFFNLEDPQIIPGASGRIDWLIESFNGTKEQPNRQLLMTSPIVRIGEYDWQIKFYPKGNRTDFLSVYIECTTMNKPDFVGVAPFKTMPLPRPTKSPPIQHRLSIAAQISVVMYNPAEPRVHEHKADAYQYHKSASDFGWKYFTQDRQSAFHKRKHGQRQAILQNDRLAFKAYIRIIHDPTGCLWQAPALTPELNVTNTSLRPFDGCSAQVAAMVMLLHLRFYRKWLEGSTAKTSVINGLRQILSKALHRRLKRKHLKYFGVPDGCDVVEVLCKMRNVLKSDPDTDAGLLQMFTVLTDNRQFIGHHRLKTRSHSSVQGALSQAPAEHSKEPPVLLIELERQRFDDKKRTWEQIKNAVKLDDHVQCGVRPYTLYGFVTHKGPLSSGHYTPFVRPGGLNGLWYMYDNSEVRCLTHRDAHLRSIGVDRSSRGDASNDGARSLRSSSAKKPDDTGIAYLAWYVRDDYGPAAWTTALEENLPAQNVMSTTPQVTRTQIDKSQPLDSKHSIVHEAALAGVNRPTLRSSTRSDERPLNLMDGEDVIMSDSEDDHAQQALLYQKLAAPGSVTSMPTSTAPEQPDSLVKKTLSFYSSECYVGHVKQDNTYQGQGILIRTNGDFYEGQFHDGVPHGQGRMLYSKSGDIYDGAWSAGQQHGHGKFIETQTGNVYEGGWKEGRRHGRFTLRGTVTEDDKYYCQICFENTIDTAFFDCGHALTCKECAKAVPSCPVCRKQVLARLELFGVKISMQ